MEIKKTIKIDLAKKGMPEVVYAVQGETNTRKVEISMLENGVAWNVPSETTVAVAFSKPDGTKGLYDFLPDESAAAIVNENKVTIVLAPQVLTAHGNVMASVVFYDSNLDVLATFPFVIFVEKNPGFGEQISNNYYALQNLEQINAVYNELLEHVEFLTEQVEAGIGVTDEQIATVVESYLNENPPDAVTEGQLAQAVEKYMTENPASGTIHVTGAAPGQTPVVKTVDGSGVPTAWEMAALPTDDHINTLIDTALGVIENGSY